MGMLKARRRKFAEDQIVLDRGGRRLTLRPSSYALEMVDGSVIGYVVTFDDITDLQAAQRRRLGRILHGALRMKSKTR